MSVCNKTVRNLCSMKDFHRLIKRERLLADRNNNKLSLILFDVELLNKCNTHIEDLIDILNTRIRLSDEIGWFDINHLPKPLHSQIGLETELIKSFLKNNKGNKK